jgi:diguanylate cyclase (GGDEF)-like protein
MTTQDWQETFGELKEQYVKRSSERISKIVEMLARLIERPADTDVISQLGRQFHWLAGSGSIYGFQEVSALGAEGENFCEGMLRHKKTPSHEDLARLKHILNTLSGEFSKNPSKAITTNLTHLGALSESTKSDILVIGEDQNDLLMLAKLVEEHQMQVRGAHSAASAMVELKKSIPAGVIIEIPLPDSDGYELVERLRNLPGGEELAIVIVSKQTGFLDKVRSIHCGADAHFEKPFDVKAMFRRLEHVLDKKRLEPAKILSVEDDPDQAVFIRAFLESAGYQVRICTDPKQFDAFLSAFQPDLVLLDVMLPGMTGYELAKYLRQNETYAALPIIFLTTQGQLEARIESAKSGVDEHLVKPVAPALLLSCVSAKLERARFLKTLMHKDGLTNLLNHSSFMEQAQAAIAYQKRHNSFLTMIVLDVDDFQSINERYGYPGGDKVLVTLSLLVRRRLRQSDLIGRLGGDELAIVAEGLDEQESFNLATRLLNDFAVTSHATASHSSFYGTLSAGLSMFDGKSMDLASWVKATYNAVSAAKQAGRNCVMSAKVDQLSKSR